MRKVIWSTFNWIVEHFNPNDLMESQAQLTHFTREYKPLFILTFVCNI